jgi:U4/U6.U5 tri-snRNP-associated protein 2
MASSSSSSAACPYLSTINRTHLDFDFEPSCSITLESSPHIYGCLICGKYFRGKGKSTPAYIHSVNEGHCVYVHLTNGTFWCLPDNYEINNTDPSLQDIKLALHPKYTLHQINILDTQKELVRDLFGRRYIPGYIGLNNLNKTDYINCVVQALGHVRPLRDFFLLAPNNYNGGDSNDGSDNGVVNGKSEGGVVDGKVESNGKRKLSTTNNSSIPYEEFSPLAKSFSLLLRNMWSPHRFKSNVDPHMFVQAVSVASNKRYHVGKQADAGEFLAWLLHQLHLGVGGSVVKPSKKKKKHKKSGKKGGSIIHETFMGTVEMTTVITRRKRRGEKAALAMLNDGGRDATTATTANKNINDDDIFVDDDDRDGSDDEETIERKRQKRETLKSLADETIIDEEETVLETQFLQLTLDIPEKPLFKDDDGGLVIPQEPLVNVLRKFDGVSFSDVLAMQQQKVTENNGNNGVGTIVSKKRRYKLKTLPNYLILHLSRFKRNGYFVEKNPTIVMFPVKNFDLSAYVFPEGGRKQVPTEEEVRGMSTKELKRLLTTYGREDVANNAIEKDELLQRCLDFLSTSLPDLLADKYDLVANITHDIPAEVGREGTKHNPLEEGTYRCHVQHKATGQWYEMQDLEVTETMPQLIGVSESYLLIFERKGAQL